MQSWSAPYWPHDRNETVRQRLRNGGAGQQSACIYIAFIFTFWIGMAQSCPLTKILQETQTWTQTRRRQDKHTAVAGAPRTKDIR